ncbi:hypothetical protein FACS189472_16810 [Alphaproteobacteria bacterium]|nr:hypothetical protein FACS189472_16810 [Alphaproteobacteria bacterium]
MQFQAWTVSEYVPMVRSVLVLFRANVLPLMYVVSEKKKKEKEKEGDEENKAVASQETAQVFSSAIFCDLIDRLSAAVWQSPQPDFRYISTYDGNKYTHLIDTSSPISHRVSGRGTRSSSRTQTPHYDSVDVLFHAITTLLYARSMQWLAHGGGGGGGEGAGAGAGSETREGNGKGGVAVLLPCKGIEDQPDRATQHSQQVRREFREEDERNMWRKVINVLSLLFWRLIGKKAAKEEDGKKDVSNEVGKKKVKKEEGEETKRRKTEA